MAPMFTHSSLKNSLSLPHISGVAIQAVYLVDYIRKRRSWEGIFMYLNESIEFVITRES